MWTSVDEIVIRTRSRWRQLTIPVERSALLVHLRNRFGPGPENLATEALAFILNQYKEARRGIYPTLSAVSQRSPEYRSIQYAGLGRGWCNS